MFRRIQHIDGTISFDYVGDGLRRVFDLDPEAVIANSEYLINEIHPDDREGWWDALNDSATHMLPYNYDARLVGEKGEAKWMRGIAHPIRKVSGEIVWDALALDITEQKQAEAEREHSNRQYRELMDAVPYAIWISQASKIVYANTDAAQMFGVEQPSDIVGRDSFSLIAAKDRAAVTRRRIDLAQGTRTAPAEIRRERADGSIIDTVTSAIGVIWEEKPSNLVIARDVTDRKKGEAQLRQAQKMEAVGQLTGGVAHDFNNLLAVLMMDLEQLSTLHKDDPETEELLQEALSVSHSAADLTARLLTFSRQQELKPERTDLRKLIAECISLLRRTIGEHLELDTITSGDLWPVVVDRRQLENALLNLTVNARDAMPSGGRITIEARNFSLNDDDVRNFGELEAGEYVRIDVTDTGSGIPSDIQEKIFDPFFTTKDVGAGTGLGLSMVYGFAKQSGGHVTIDSEEGNGASVRLYLPRASTENSAACGAGPESHSDPYGDETILLVEDFPQLRKRGAQMLAKLGYTVIDARNGTEALAALEAAGRIDLLFTDLVMPGGMNGFDLAEMARAIQPDLKVLYTSGYAEGAEIDFGAADSSAIRLHKPYSRRDLARTIRRALDD